MAGLGETCSHVAATVFYLEYAAKAKEEMVGTDELCALLPPTLGKTVLKRRINEMDFSSPAARLIKTKRVDQNCMYWVQCYEGVHCCLGWCN